MKNRAFDYDLERYPNWIDPKEVMPYPRNAKLHPPEQIATVVNSITRFGWQQDTVITADNVLVVGHGRRLAALEIGCKMPYHRVGKNADELTDAEIDALRLADNKVAESGWDFAQLEAELAELSLEFDMTDFGFEDVEGTSVDEPETAEEDDFDPDEPVEAKAKLGDIYQLGEHRLMCGDSTDMESVAKLLDGEKVDMVFTDPPYGVNVKGGKDKGNMIMGDLTQTAIPFAFEIAVTKCTKEKAHFYFCGGEGNIQLYQKLFDRYLHILPKHLIWVKNGFVMKQNGYHNQFEIIYHGYKQGSGGLWYGGRTEEEASDVWHINRDPSSAYLHPTQKPLGVPARAIKNSCPPNGSVADLFGGSGSTLIACEQLDRRCYMMELDPHYVDVIIARWEKFTGQEAVLLNG